MRAYKPLQDLLAPHIRGNAGWLALGVLLSLAQGVLALLTPWFAGQFAAGLLASAEVSPGTVLGSLALIWAAVLLAQALARFGSSYLLTRSGARIVASLSRRLHEHLLALPLTFFQSRKRGDLLALYSHDITALAHFVTGTLASLLPIAVVLAGALILMARLDLGLALVIAALLPWFFLVLKLLGRRARPVSERLANAQGAKLALAGEQFSLMPLLKGSADERNALARYDAHNQSVLGLRSEQLRIQALLAPVLQLLSALAVLAVLWLSAQHYAEGRLALPELVSLLMYGLLLTRPVSGLANIYGEAQQAMGATRRLHQVFTEAAERDTPGAQVLPEGPGAIDIENVTFAYPGQVAVLEQLSLRVTAGEVVAITGENGAGKSTLLQLLMRFVEPAQGRTVIDGCDIASVQRRSLRSQIGLVTQAVLLCDGSIEDNIRLGSENASAGEVVEAARLAQAQEFIEALPEGYASQVGEGGVKLSGGQRQKLALARALLRQPRILLLDEATAMFDPTAEARLVDASREAFAGRTVLMVTHRPASLAAADRILKLENGKLHAVDPRSNLVKLNVS